MSAIKELQKLIENSLEKRDPIEDIQPLFSDLYEVGPTPSFCLNLFIPLLHHAVDNVELMDKLDGYNTILNELCTYMYENESCLANKLFNTFQNFAEDILSVFEEGSIVNSDYAFNLEEHKIDSLLCYLAIAALACEFVVRSYKRDLFFGSNLNKLWATLPRILNCCRLEHDPTTVKIIKAVCDISVNIIDRNSANVYNAYVEEMLNNLLSLLFDDQLPEPILDELADKISHIIQAYPNMKLSDPSAINSFTNSIASSLERKEFSALRIKTVLNLSCLLMKNHSKVPWLNDVLLIATTIELEVLKEKASLLSEYTYNFTYEAPPLELMDVDQNSSTTHAINDTKDVVDCTFINQKLLFKLDPAIQELINLNAGDTKYPTILSRITDLSIYTDNTDILVMCRPYMQVITNFVTENLALDPDMAQAVVNIFGMELSQFISTNLRYALPYAITSIHTDDCLLGISNLLDLSGRRLCENNAPSIIVALLMESNPNIKSHGYKRLQRIFETNSAVHKTLAINNGTKITTRLAMNLGIPNIKDQALDALKEMQKLVNMASLSLSEYLSQFIFAILTEITNFISDKKVQNDDIISTYEPHTLDALREIMIVMRPNIGEHALHLMKTFQAINDIEGMQLEALVLWKQFISLMDDSDVLANFNGIVHGLLQIFPGADHDVRVAVASTIEDVLNIKSQSSSSSLSDLPILPDFKELTYITHFIERSLDASKTDVTKQLATVLSNLESTDDVQVLFELQKLEKILSTHQVISVDYASFYSRLLYLIRKHSSHERIPSLAAKCLGKLGAVNPSLVDVKLIDDGFFLMEGFSNDTDNREFICGLLSDHIFPAYNATSDEKTHLYLRASIQSLLTCADFTDLQTMRNSRPAVYKRWLLLPPSMKNFLQPFLQSSFKSTYRGSTTQYPIFNQAKSFSQWVQDWYCCMLGVTRGKTHAILDACLGVVMSDQADFTSFLIPHMVFFIVVNCSGDEIIDIRNEMLSILDTNAEYGTDTERSKFNLQALQVVVSITEYLRQWLNKVKLNDRKYDSSVSRITQFLEQIPDKKMAIAAFHTGAYVQALMHFESFIKSQPKGVPVEPSVLNYLQRIYTQLDNPVDLSALMEIYYSILGHDAEITRFETSGRWQEAEVLYRNKLDENSTDLNSHLGYLNCLKKWGSYDTILRVADKISTNVPNLSAQINCFRIDSAWRLQDWYTLERAVELPVQKKTEALIGCTLAKLRRKQNLEAACSIEEARNNLIEHLTSNTTATYRKSYPIIYNLQLLQELDDAQRAWEAGDPIQNISNLQNKWDNTSKNVISTYQYKHNLLELRKAVFFDIRPSEDTAPLLSELLVTMAKSFRKSGNLLAALDALTKAEKVSGKSFRNEKAKWYWAKGYKDEAIQLLKTKSLQFTNAKDAILLTKFYREDPTCHDSGEIRQYFRQALKTENNEKIYHYCASFYYNILSKNSQMNINKIKTMFYIASSSVKALRCGSKYYHSTISRLINTWFELEEYTREPLNPAIATEVRTSLSSLNDLMRTVTDTVPAYQFSPVLPRLLSHLNVSNNDVGECLVRIIYGVFTTYPRSTIWLLKGASLTEKQAVCRLDSIYYKARAMEGNPKIGSYINQTNELVRLLKILSLFKPRENTSSINMSTESDLSPLVRMRDLDIFIPTEASLFPVLPEVNGRRVNPFPINLPTIKKIHGDVLVMRSLQKPKRITVEGSDGNTYMFLVKTDDDLRKDARSMELNYAINSFLKKTPESRDNALYIRTYAVIPLGVKWGLIQWIDNISPLKKIINDLLPSDATPINELTISFKRAQDNLKLDSEVLNHFKKVILPRCPNVFYKWFLKCFPEPNQWLSSRERYIKTLAVMSIVGYMIGLGDRHAENILFDESNGDCVHVDLNMLFDQGKGLTIPEIVPFRLTHNLVDAMGITGYKGTFTQTCDITMNVMLQNKDALTSVFKTLVNSWTTTETAKNDIRSTEQRFRLAPGDAAHHKVRELIAQATDTQRLSKMFAGWAPFL